jgi:hypothetical protein
MVLIQREGIATTVGLYINLFCWQFLFFITLENISLFLAEKIHLRFSDSEILAERLAGPFGIFMGEFLFMESEMERITKKIFKIFLIEFSGQWKTAVL